MPTSRDMTIFVLTTTTTTTTTQPITLPLAHACRVINWYSGMLSTINHKWVCCAGLWAHAAPSGPCIGNSSLFRTCFCHLYSLYLVGNINIHFNNPLPLSRPQNSENLVHLKCSRQGNCECFNPYHMNPRLIEGKHATVRLSCCPSDCHCRSSVTDTLPRSYFCYLCHQGHGLSFSHFSVPMWEHAVAVFPARYIPHLASQPTLCG